jgi:hypothetical protein
MIEKTLAVELDVAEYHLDFNKKTRFDNQLNRVCCYLGNVVSILRQVFR